MHAADPPSAEAPPTPFAISSGQSNGERPEGALDLHKAIAHKGADERVGCGRWPEHMRLLNPATGELVTGRCRASKLCAYCGLLAAVENAEMVALDAVEDAPLSFVVLTTRDPYVTRAQVRLDLQHAVQAVRRRLSSSFEYACFVEFTTGLSVWSGGHRRIHLNLLCKGVGGGDHDELRDVLLSSWGASTNTTQLHVGAVYAAEGLVAYVTNLALHVMKAGQKPPASYEGHLVRWSRGYFARGATAMRSEARRSLKVKRAMYRGLDAVAAELEVAMQELDEWLLVNVENVPGELRWADTGRKVVA
jgi:hypothetical protein